MMGFTPGPGPIPGPWLQTGPTVYYPNGGVVLPDETSVPGGNKGKGTINAQSIFINGQPVGSSGSFLPIVGGTLTGDLAIALTAPTQSPNPVAGIQVKYDNVLFGDFAGYYDNGWHFSSDIYAYSSAGYGAGYSSTMARGTHLAPAAVQNGDKVAWFQANGYEGQNYVYGPFLSFDVQGTPSVGYVPIMASMKMLGSIFGAWTAWAAYPDGHSSFGYNNAIVVTPQGVPQVPTAAPGTNTVQIASTAFVTGALASFTPPAGSISLTVNTNPTSGFTDTSYMLSSGGKLNQGTLLQEATDSVAQRRGTNPQRFNLYNTYTDANNWERLGIAWNANQITIAMEALGTGNPNRVLELNAQGTSIDITSGGVTVYRNGTSNSTQFTVAGTGLNAATLLHTRLAPSINQSGTASYTILDINPTETAVGSGAKLFARGRLGAGADLFNIDHAGVGYFQSLGAGIQTPLAKVHASVPDDQLAALFSGTARGVRIVPETTYTKIEGVDQTGSGSFQPVYLNGSVAGSICNFVPFTDNTVTLGDPTHTWQAIYCQTRPPGTNDLTAATTAFVAAALAAVSASLPPGVMMDWAGATGSIPTGWLLCDGRAVSRTGANANLFAAIGVLYGAGDGSTTFNLPDLRGRVVVGIDPSGTAGRVTSAISGIASQTLGATGGDQQAASHNHGAGSLQAPAHNHGGSGVGLVGNNLTNGTSRAVGTADGTNSGYYQDVQLTNISVAGPWGLSGTTASQFGGAAQNMPPAIVMNKIIKM